MSLCEYCLAARLSKCDLNQQLETETALMETRTSLISEEPDRVPEMEEVQLQEKINQLRLQLRATAIERGCTEFK